MEKFLTTEDACRLYQCSPTTLWRWRQTGKLKALRTPGNTLRYRAEDIEEALTEEPKEEQIPA